MGTVIDLGPVDWGQIWAHRGAWVSPAHFAELNAITNATHLSHPGYWRNLFASYPEVAAKAGQIAHQFLIPGRVEQHFASQMAIPMIKPDAMNSFTQKEHQNALNQQKENDRIGRKYLEDNPRFNVDAPLGDKLLDMLRNAPVAKQVVDAEQAIQQEVVDTYHAGKKFVGDISDNAVGFGYAAIAIAGVVALIALRQ